MSQAFSTITYFMIFFPMVYITYTCLKAFDYAKILRRGKVGDLKILLFVVAVGLSSLFASAIIEIIERIANFFT